MITGIWKKVEKNINKKKVIIRYDKAAIEDMYKKGSTMIRIVYKCDNKTCKYPDKFYSIQRHHLNINRSSKLHESLQICVFCQRGGESNPRYGDHRSFNEIYGIEKAKNLKENLSRILSGNGNPSKLDSVKYKKGQIIINFDSVSKLVNINGYKLLSIDGENKSSMLYMKCDKGHDLEMMYERFKRGNRCKWCYYDSIKLNLDEETINEYENYKKVIRYNVRSTYKKYKDLIDPLNLKSNPKEYHIDHIYSISEGFRNNIDPKIISSPVNLRVIKNCDNLLKGSKCDITIEELIGNYNIFIRSTV